MIIFPRVLRICECGKPVFNDIEHVCGIARYANEITSYSWGLFHFRKQHPELTDLEATLTYNRIRNKRRSLRSSWRKLSRSEIRRHDLLILKLEALGQVFPKKKG